MANRVLDNGDEAALTVPEKYLKHGNGVATSLAVCGQAKVVAREINRRTVSL